MLIEAFDRRPINEIEQISHGRLIVAAWQGLNRSQSITPATAL
jgi:hypothetical protein